MPSSVAPEGGKSTLNKEHSMQMHHFRRSTSAPILLHPSTRTGTKSCAITSTFALLPLGPPFRSVVIFAVVRHVQIG